jgi:hypothetical protein
LRVVLHVIRHLRKGLSYITSNRLERQPADYTQSRRSEKRVGMRVSE